MASGNFEHSLARLEEVVQLLERGDLPLEESLVVFEEGVSLSSQCQDRLDAAEKRVVSLSCTEDLLRAEKLVGITSDSQRD